MTQVGITGGGNGTHMIYINGKKDHRISNKELPSYLETIIRKKADEIISSKKSQLWKFLQLEELMIFLDNKF